MDACGISKPDHIYVILVLPSGERRCSLCTYACLITQVAEELGLNLRRITVFYEDNCIEAGLTAEDCCIESNGRLTVYINEEPKIISQHTCIPTPAEQAEQDRHAEQEAPLRRVNASIWKKRTSGLIGVDLRGKVRYIFVIQETSCYNPLNNRFSYSTAIDNWPSEYPLDTKAIQSDDGLITLLRDRDCVFKTLEEHQEHYVLTRVG